MKKLVTLLLFSLVCLWSYSQTNENRLIIYAKSNPKGYLVERIDSIGFKKLPGEVKTSLKINDVKIDTVKFTATKASAACVQYYFQCLKKTIADYLADDAAMAAYCEKTNIGVGQDSVYNGILAGLEPATEYVLVTVGIDAYGIACGVARAPFKTLQRPLVGNPKVESKITEIKPTTFTLEFTPNADVLGYAAVAGIKGTMLQQYKQWGPMFGFGNFGDLVKAWGVKFTSKDSHTWKGMLPNTDYEVFVQAWDENNTYTVTDTIQVHTATLGGEGKSVVAIEVKEFGKSNDQTYQRVIFTPNDQTAGFRDMILTKEYYDKNGGDKFVKDYLGGEASEQHPMYYATDDAQYNADANTTYYACSMGVNAKGEWGDITKVEFTTPAKPVDGIAKKATMIPTRISSSNQGGVSPISLIKVSTANKGIQISK